MKTVRYLRVGVIFFLFASVSLVWAHGDKHKKKEREQKTGHWAAPRVEKDRINPFASTDESISRGEVLYRSNCTECHGVNGDGKGPDAPYMTPAPSNLKAMAGHHSDGDLSWKIRRGKGPMPGWEEVFTEEQIWDLVNYIQNLKQKKQAP